MAGSVAAAADFDRDDVLGVAPAREETDARAGDLDAGAIPAFDDVYREHVDLVWRTLRRYGVPTAALDDAIQDAFVVVHRRLPTFERRSSVRTWIFGIARRVARDHRTRGAEMANADVLDALPDVESSSPLTTLETVEAARELEHLLAALAPEKREAFILVKLEQMTFLEAAQALGVNPNTIYSRVRTACREIEQALTRLHLHEDAP